MLNEIKNCDKCAMCKNQQPLLDNVSECDVMWVGLSAKQVENVIDEVPLSSSTRSGKLIAEIEGKANSCKYYKTNVVKCLPLNEKGKLRYPTMKEMDLCITNLLNEINILKPKMIILLGKKVIKSVEKTLEVRFEEFNEYEYRTYKLGEINIVPIHHPSYISVYKRKTKEVYVETVSELIYSLIYDNKMHKPVIEV